jgi:uncharacterized damage-inducible protein DinB
MKNDRALRAQLVKLLDWREAHAGFDAAVKGIPPRLRGAVPEGWQYSAWQLLEHIRIAQADILDFCRNPKYRHKKWPDDYWPKSPAPPRSAAWTKSLAAYRRDLRAFKRLAADVKIDLFAAIPHGTGQTYLREIVLLADHTTYHVGQLIALRRQLGVWKQT